MSDWFFLYQRKGGEEDWTIEVADKRASVQANIKPAFVSVLDLTSIPLDNDWSKVRYRGGLYFDFDADGDLELACDQFKVFIGKLDSELGFDVTQARLYASGGKGFHVEIPSECFMVKVPPGGTTWLPYIYKEMAERLVVDTMDMRVYSGKRGRMWRTPNVVRENGRYKVSLPVVDAMDITPESYVELVSEPRLLEEPTPPSMNAKFAMLFNEARDKTNLYMRGEKKRKQKANVFLDPWKQAKKNPPTLEKLMAGEIVAENAGFQSLSMQLSIYATSVGMPLEDFVAKCEGLINNHVSDSYRYNTPGKRSTELARMWRYMNENSIYEFDPAPILKLIKPGTVAPDLGIQEQNDTGDVKAKVEGTVEELDQHRGIRKGFFMNAEGMWRRVGEVTESICRATLRNVESFYEVDDAKFSGYEFDVVEKGSKTFRTRLGADAFASSSNLKKFFVNYQIGFQGGDFEVMSLLDIMADKAKKGGKVFVYPREGLVWMRSPVSDSPELVPIYLTKETFISSLAENEEGYFKLRYRPNQAISSYNIDIHRAPPLSEEHKSSLHDLFSFSKEDVIAKLLGWFVASHFRSLYLAVFNQFPILQVYGEAGAGKSQTIWMLAHLHWYHSDVPMPSAVSGTPFAIDSAASTSTSAPFILDEWKPREIKANGRGKYEKLKDVLKASYIGADIGNRGTINKGAENNLAVIKSKATAPIVFIGESLEQETAIVERCLLVSFTKSYHSKLRTQAFERLHSNPEPISALGNAIRDAGFSLNIEGVRNDVRKIIFNIEKNLPDIDDENVKRAAPRIIFNRAIAIHGLGVLKHVLSETYGNEFDKSVDVLIGSISDSSSESENSVAAVASMSEISKVMNRIALLSREPDAHYAMLRNKDYLIGDGFIEIKVEKAYDQYRRYIASIHDTALFDTLESFIHALNSYHPVIDKTCVSSDLRVDGSNERIVRLHLRRLMKEGVQTFRDS